MFNNLIFRVMKNVENDAVNGKGKRKIAIVCVAVVSLCVVAFGCDKLRNIQTGEITDGLSNLKNPVCKDISVSNCKRSNEGDEKPSSVQVICRDNYLYITHSDLVLNCCYEEVSVVVSVNGNTIELDIIEKEPYGCRCTCPFDVSYSVGKFENGRYSLIIRLRGQQIHSQTVII